MVATMKAQIIAPIRPAIAQPLGQCGAAACPTAEVVTDVDRPGLGCQPTGVAVMPEASIEIRLFAERAVDPSTIIPADRERRSAMDQGASMQ